MDGMIVMGDVDEGIQEEKVIEIDDIEEVVEEEEDDEIIFGMINEEPPRFRGTKNSSNEGLKKSFSDSISKFITTNFNFDTTINFGWKSGSKKKIWAQFTISEKGNITDIKVKAPHEKLEEHTIEILKKLPQFIPGKQRGKPVNVKYTLPITFVVK